MAEVLQFTGTTRLPDTSEAALEKAKAWGMDRVVICGWAPDGKFHFGGSHCEIGEALLLLELCKNALVNCASEQSGG